MAPDSLRPTSFRGDPDVEELHAFFQPDRQFAGDTLWTFGTSLKSAYVDSFEFLNSAPVVQLWRDSKGDVQAVSRISLGFGEWFYLAAPVYRRPEVALAILEQADAAMELLSGRESWRTVCYESDRGSAALLEERGYESDGLAEVYMERSLREAILAVPDPEGCVVRELNSGDLAEVTSRGEAQTDAFIDDQPYAQVSAWMRRSTPNQLGYGRPLRHPHIIAIDPAGTVLAFADVFLDHTNKVCEFEPVGTRPKMWRRGLAKAVITRGLEQMKNAGMQQAVVRTGYENAAAIAAYASVGFETTDRLVRLRKSR